MKKGQIAMETILIYGAALLVVGLAIGALIYFGVLDLGSLLPNKCEMAGVKLTCDAYSLTGTASGGQLLIEMTNRIGKRITIEEVSIVGEEDYGDVSETLFISTDDGTTFTTVTAPEITVANGQKFLVATNEVSTTDTEWYKSLAGTAGSRIKGRIQIKYTVGTSTVSQYETGQILGEVVTVATSDFTDTTP